MNTVTLRVLLWTLALLTSPMAFAAPGGEQEHFDATWTMKLPRTGPGYGVAFLPEANPPAVSDWVEPNVAGVLAIGFDTDNPPPTGSDRDKYFNAQGNFYDRPQREVSLHFNGREIANRLCPVSLTKPEGDKVQLHIDYVPGGAELTLAVDGTPVYDHYFVPEATPYRANLTFGSGQPTTQSATWSGARFTGVKPVSVLAFDKALNNKNHYKVDGEATFPATLDNTARVVCTLTLAPTPEGLDPWDRLGHIWITGADGEQYEVVRYITPYRKAWEWKVDVTDLLPLFQDKRKMQVDCETYAEGWLVSVRFDFYPGKPKMVPYRVVNLWNGFYDIGNPEKPFAAAVRPRSISTDVQTIAAKTRITVTGHGQNKDNLGEFAPLWRQVYCGGQVWENTLWKTDVYLNPCRPQGGTWKFDRAGWAPGEAVLPWEVDLTPVLHPGQPLDILYVLQPYTKQDKDEPGRHSFASQLILYRKN